MKRKEKTFKNGASASLEKLSPSGIYLVELWDHAGSLLDKIRCDDYQESLAYFRSFSKIAKNA